jgi:Uma2 family endonuclease
MSATIPPRTSPSARHRQALLENGQSLTGDEFMRRYAAMPEVKKAELIEGIVFMGSPVRIDEHGKPDSLIQMWLGYYAVHTPGLEVGTNATLILDPPNRPQPDALLRLLSSCGGQSGTSDDGYVFGAPELVAEVSSSSVSLDLRAKLEIYRRNGVREYLVWRVEEEGVSWFQLRGGQFELLAADSAGVFRSPLFPGLWLDTRDLLAMDGAQVLACLQASMNMAEYRGWRDQLAERVKSSEHSKG